MSEIDQAVKIEPTQEPDRLPDREKLEAERTPILDIVFGDSVEQIIQDSIKAREKFSDGGSSAEILYGPDFTAKQQQHLELLQNRKVGKRALVKVSRQGIPSKSVPRIVSESFAQVLTDQLISVQPFIRDFACATSHPILTPNGRSAFLIEEAPTEMKTRQLDSYDVNALLYQLAFLKFQMHKLGLGSPDSLTKEWDYLSEGGTPRIVCYDLGFSEIFPQVGSISYGSEPGLVADKARTIITDIFHFREALQRYFLPRFPAGADGTANIIADIDQTLSATGIADLWAKSKADENFLAMASFANILVKIPGLSANERVLEKIIGHSGLIRALHQDTEAAILTFKDIDAIKTESLDEMEKKRSKTEIINQIDWISNAVKSRKLSLEFITNGRGGLVYLKDMLLRRGLLTKSSSEIGAWAKIQTIDS